MCTVITVLTFSVAGVSLEKESCVCLFFRKMGNRAEYLTLTCILA